MAAESATRVVFFVFFFFFFRLPGNRCDRSGSGSGTGSGSGSGIKIGVLLPIVSTVVF